MSRVYCPSLRFQFFICVLDVKGLLSKSKVSVLYSFIDVKGLLSKSKVSVLYSFICLFVVCVARWCNGY